VNGKYIALPAMIRLGEFKEVIVHRQSVQIIVLAAILFSRLPLQFALSQVTNGAADSYSQATTEFHTMLDDWADLDKVQQAFALAETKTTLHQNDYARMAQYDRWRHHAMDGVTLMRRAIRLYPQPGSLSELARCEYEAGLVADSQASMARLVRNPIPQDLMKETAWLAWKIARKTWELSIELTPDPINTAKGFIRSRGYYEVYTRPDNAFQKTTVTYSEVQSAEWTTDTAGNLILKLKPLNWDSPVHVKMVVSMIPVAYKLTEKNVAPDAMPEDVRKFLGDGPLGPAKTRPLINPSGPTAASLAKGLKGATRGETIENIRNWVMGQVKYADTLDPPPSKDAPGEQLQKDSELVLQRKRGFCWENAKAMTAVLRAAGIPARRVLMLNIFPSTDNEIWPKKVLTGGHVMAEYWDPNAGWVPIQDRPASVCGLVGPILASELPDEPDPNGTPERVFNESYYGGGNGRDPYANMTLRTVRYTFGQ